MSEEIKVTPDEVSRRKAYLEITAADEDRLRRAHAIIQRHTDRIIDEFYRYLLSTEHTRKMLQEPGVLERVKGLQRRYFERLTSGTYDEAYFEDRIKVGYAHDRIGLTPEWYLGAYNKYLSVVSDVLSREMGRDYQGFFDMLVSLTKIVHLDMGLAMDAYSTAGKARVEERNRRLQELDSKKQLLAETIIHDLRNPVAGLQGFIAVLKSSAAGLTPSQRAAMIEAERACGTLNAMIDNVLMISRMEEGKLQTLRENVDLSELADEMVRAYSPLASARGKMLRTKAASKPVEARTDREVLHRILSNLVMNSIRHATGANFVEIEASRDPSGRSRLSVADDGPGIPKQYHSLIFEKFGGANLRKTGLKLDTGLGLVFCRMATRELGGELILESDAGQGTKFSVVL